MHIVYDGHIFRWQKSGGISRYFSEIISKLPSDCTPTVLGVNRRDHNFPQHPNLQVSPLCSLRPRRFSQPVKTSWWRNQSLAKAQVFHPTFYTLSGGLAFADVKRPTVITVHDLIQARFPHLEDESEVTLRNQREAISHAAHVICVSRATELDALEYFPASAGKTSVIYHGSSFPICSEPQQEDIFERPTFLYVGRRGTYKNFLFLLRAFAKACQSRPTIRLHVAGPALTEEERWQMHFLAISDRVDSFVFPDEPMLRNLYRRSVALLYPSRLEGFGIPPVEAMACGTLAITSNTTSLPEVVGDGGIMLDPTDESAWAECILAVSCRKVPRDVLLTRGRLRAESLTWSQSASKHLEIYRMLS